MVQTIQHYIHGFVLVKLDTSLLPITEGNHFVMYALWLMITNKNIS